MPQFPDSCDFSFLKLCEIGFPAKYLLFLISILINFCCISLKYWFGSTLYVISLTSYNFFVESGTFCFYSASTALKLVSKLFLPGVYWWFWVLCWMLFSPDVSAVKWCLSLILQSKLSIEKVALSYLCLCINFSSSLVDALVYLTFWFKVKAAGISSFNLILFMFWFSNIELRFGSLSPSST